MKKLFLNLLLVITLFLKSCAQDDVVTESCLEIDKVSESLVSTQFEVDKIEEIIFKLISSYEVDFSITNSKFLIIQSNQYTRNQ